jgi:hypothetical protein
MCIRVPAVAEGTLFISMTGRKHAAGCAYDAHQAASTDCAALSLQLKSMCRVSARQFNNHVLLCMENESERGVVNT